MIEQDLTIHRGDDETLTLQVVRSNVPLDITGASLWFTAKRSFSDSDDNAQIRKTTALSGGISITNPTTGLVEISIRGTDTANLTFPPGIAERDKERYVMNLYYDVQIKLSTGSVFTIARGTLSVMPDITQATS